MCGGGGHEYFIPTKFGKYPSSDSVVKADSVFQYIYLVHVYTSATPPPPTFHFNLINKFLKNSLKFPKHLNLYYMHSPTYKHGHYMKLL